MYRVVVTILFALITVPPAAAELSIEAAIDQRQAAFKAMKEEVRKLKEALSAGKPADSDAIRAPAGQIAANSKQLIGTFVAGSHEGKTRAKKKIWENQDDFERRQNQLIDDAGSLLAASEAGDQSDLVTAFKNLSKNCKGCHQRYRQIF